MSKQSNTKPSESRSNSNQRIPSGNFNTDGVSQGKQSGAVRPTPDANNTNKSGEK